jgi:hypothetical protein
MDRTWHSLNRITLTFHPENEIEARSYIAGLIPYLKASAHPWFLKHFSEEARLHHSTSTWDPETCQAYTEEEAELDILPENDAKLNFMDEMPTNRTTVTPEVQIHVQHVAEREEIPKMCKDNDSISTFHPITPATSSTPSVRFAPKHSISSTTMNDDNFDSVSKMTDSD